MAFLAWLEQSSFPTWIHESTSIWAFPTILTFHTLGMGLLAGAIAMVDLRILGVVPLLPLSALEPFLRVMWIGFWVNALSGTLLFAASATMHAQNPALYVKLVFVGLGMLTGEALRREVFRRPGNAEPGAVRMKGKILAGVSLALWTGAITAGRLMAYVGPTR